MHTPKNMFFGDPLNFCLFHYGIFWSSIKLPGRIGSKSVARSEVLARQAITEGTDEMCPPGHLSQQTPETPGNGGPAQIWWHMPCSFHTRGGQSFEPYFTHNLAFQKTPTDPCRAQAFSQIALEPIQNARKLLHLATGYSSLNLLQIQKKILCKEIVFLWYAFTKYTHV